MSQSEYIVSQQLADRQCFADAGPDSGHPQANKNNRQNRDIFSDSHLQKPINKLPTTSRVINNNLPTDQGSAFPGQHDVQAVGLRHGDTHRGI